MKKVTSSILLGLACASILSLSTEGQSVQASSDSSVKQSQVSSDILQDFTFKKGPDFYFGTFSKIQANNLANGYITDKTTKISIAYNMVTPGQTFVLRDSSGYVKYTLPSELSGQVITIDTPFKVGETYKLGTNMSSEEYFSFTVVSGETIGVPTINKVTNLDKIVTGTGVSGANIHLNIGGENYTGMVDNQGNYSISLNKTYSTDSSITIYQEKDGIKSETITSKVVESDKIPIPNINKVTTNDQYVTGTGIPGANIYLTINGVHFHSKVSDNGTFSINIEKKYPANTPIEAYQEYNGIKSETTTVYVQLSADLVVQKIKTDSTSITGSDLPNTNITVRIDDMDFAGTTDNNGQFSINLQGYTFKAGTDVTVTSQRSDGPVTKTVQIYPKDPVVGVAFAGDNDIRGTADPGSTVTITIGTTKYQTQADTNGNFRQSVDPSLMVSGAIVTVYSTSNGLESDKIKESVI